MLWLKFGQDVQNETDKKTGVTECYAGFLEI